MLDDVSADRWTVIEDRTGELADLEGDWALITEERSAQRNNGLYWVLRQAVHDRDIVKTELHNSGMKYRFTRIVRSA